MKKSSIISLLLIDTCLAVFSATNGGTLDTAVFAGGKFYYLERAFLEIYGVIDVETGYAGGTGKNPNGENFARLGYVEAVRVEFTRDRVSYKELLDVFFRNVDPTDGNGQFAERGREYRTILFWNDEAQAKQAGEYKASLAKSGRFPKPMVTEISKAGDYYKASKSEQRYSEKNMSKFESMLSSSGRIAFLEKIWGKEAATDPGAPPGFPSKMYVKEKPAELAKRLTPLQLNVTQSEGTEPAFRNEYWDNHEEGIYVDIVSGEPLFSSLDKYNSGTGWPSFYMPLVPENIVTRVDRGFGMERVEVRSRHADSHLGHLFDDGPQPTGLRYCMNSASLRFIPVSDLEKEGYARFVKFFAKSKGMEK